MHAIFIPYGIKDCVDLLLRDMQSQKFICPVEKDGQIHRPVLQGSLRVLPFGFYEYVFPKEYKDVVLTTLNFHLEEGDRYQLGKMRIALCRKLLKAKKWGEINSTQKLPWIKDNVEIIPIGIREDVDITHDDGSKHEAL